MQHRTRRRALVLAFGVGVRRRDAIKAKDKPRLENAYRAMLQSSISCHQASGKPYIRPHVPDAPEVRTLNFKPQGAGR